MGGHLSNLPEYVFCDCPNLASILAIGVIKIHFKALRNCNSLEHLKFAEEFYEDNFDRYFDERNYDTSLCGIEIGKDDKYSYIWCLTNFRFYYTDRLSDEWSNRIFSFNHINQRTFCMFFGSIDIYSNYKDNGIKSIEKIDDSISKFKVTFNDNSTKIIEVNSDGKTVENIAEQGLSNPEVNNNDSEVDNKKLEEQEILINIDKGIEAIDESILSLDDKVLLNSMVRKMFADKANAENIMDKINEIINKIAEKTDPLSIDVINEIQNQFERILNEFSC